MLLGRVVRQCTSHIRVATPAGHCSLSTRSPDFKIISSRNVSSAGSSATRSSQKPTLATSAAHTRRKIVRSRNAAVSVSQLFEDNLDKPSYGVSNGHGSDVESESDSDVKGSARPVGRSPTLDSLKTKLAQYDGFTLSHEQWRDFEAAVCTDNPQLKTSWMTLAMSMMLQHGCVQLAASLIDYLRHEKSSLTITTMCTYIALQGRHGREDKELIISDMYQKVKEISDVFDSHLSKLLIIGLSVTSLWQETLELLEMAKFSGNVGPSYYSPIIQAAVQQGDNKLCFSLLEEVASKGFQPFDSVVEEMLKVCRQSGSNDLLERYLLEFVWEYNWSISQTLASDIEKHFTQSDQEKWTCRWTNVDIVRGNCFACKHSLPRLDICSSDFEAMQREFLEKTLVGDNIYLKSNPQEVEKFCDFVQENAPFDIVLDALNIALVNKKLSRSKQLREMVHYFTHARCMRVLVLGRKHMLKWNSADMDYIQRHAKTFFTDNVSSDDPFCLYATLYSGKDCLFVSRDFMRDHKFNLGLRFKDVFERWQRSRQILNFWVEHHRVTVKMPNQYDCGPVKDEKGWHIPYDDGNLRLTATSQPVLCLRYKGPKAQKAKKETAEDT